MAETRDVRLYIYNGDGSKGEGLTLIGSQSFALKDKQNEVSSESSESTDPNTGVKTKITTTKTTIYSYEVTLSKLEYHKKVYEPCQIVANLQVGVLQTRTDVEKEVLTTYSDGKTSTETSIDKGHFKPVEMIGNDKIDLIKGSTVELKIDNNLVAENYFVHKVRSVYKTVSGKTSLFVELTIFSRDKLMTLDKYSRAYTAKKLYTDILSQEAEKFSSVEVANHMQLLKYQDSSTKTTNRDELRIPYLVQYNESFYNFMVRCANRFGEFLYFEDGKLNLGMQPSETNYYSRDASGNVSTQNGVDVVIDWATEPNAVQSRYYESVISEGISVEDRAYDFTGHTPDEGEENAYAESSDSRYNFDPVATNEWTNQELKSKKYHELGEIMREEMKAYVAELVFKSLEQTTLGEAVVQLSKESIEKVYEVWNTVADYNNQLDYANYKDEDDNYKVEADQRSNSKYSQFATYGGSTNLSDNLSKMFGESGVNNFTDLFYQLIRKKEKETGEQAVWLDFGNYYRPIKLGDKLRVANKDYVAISVEGSYENGQEHLLVSAIPVYSLSTNTATPQTATTSGDAWTTTIPFPPAIPDVIIRDARPQVAFVADTMDPQNLGRIRVRYPWQDAEGDMSPWIRLTLPLATTGGGVNFTPCVGDEVMVGYEHGNIDRPYGMGYLTAPFVNEKWSNALPLDQYGGTHGIKTKTGHHLTFEDGFAFAPLLVNTLGPLAFVKSLWPIGKTGPIDWPFANETTSDFGGGFELSDRYGFYRIKGSTDERSVTIESPAGTVELNAFQGITINAPNGDIEIKGKNVSISASNQLSIEAGANIKDKLRYQKNWNKGALGVASSMGSMAVDALDEGFGALLSETVGEFCDMSFLRCVMEYFLHPVNGTLQIKSYTFVTIEAGEGETALPPTSLRKLDDHTKKVKKVVATTYLIHQNVNQLLDNLREKYQKVCDATAAFLSISADSNINKNESAIDYSTVINKGETAFTLEDTAFKWDSTDLKYEDETFDKTKPEESDYTTNGVVDEAKRDRLYAEYSEAYYANKQLKRRNQRRKKKRQTIVNVANKLRVAAQELADAAKKWTTMKSGDVATFNIKKDDADTSAVAKKIQAETLISGRGMKSLDDMINKSYKKTISMPVEEIWSMEKKAMSRYIISQYLSDQSLIKLDKTLISSWANAFNEEKWGKFAESLEYNDTPSNAQKFFSWAKEHIKEDVLSSFMGAIDNQKLWAHGVQGKILMSDQADKTVSFDDNLNLKSHDNQEYVEEMIEDLKKKIKKY